MLFLGITCPSLPLPTDTDHANFPQKGDATVVDIGETLGPCLGRKLSNLDVSTFRTLQTYT